ncbi:hypothetical protein EVAR_36214_1 [Eumeta japonica]|uniref:Uncharacterized protein n=1 Tax=Eumeta variegata TaxID=151549 RepID=A0A4C1VSZ7_EUMVA|nr:hypothetical protein EVAR_36214_1 [Eumeta japonica]
MKGLFAFAFVKIGTVTCRGIKIKSVPGIRIFSEIKIKIENGTRTAIENATGTSHGAGRNLGKNEDELFAKKKSKRKRLQVCSVRLAAFSGGRGLSLAARGFNYGPDKIGPSFPSDLALVTPYRTF